MKRLLRWMFHGQLAGIHAMKGWCWHHWHAQGPARELEVRVKRCALPQTVVAKRERCCRCERLRWREWSPLDRFGGLPGGTEKYRDAQVVTVGAVYPDPLAAMAEEDL